MLTADDVRHIIRRHGQNGEADHSMAEVETIARMSYVLENYDTVTWNGEVSKYHYFTKDGVPSPQIQIQKRINGEYFIVEVASD